MRWDKNKLAVCGCALRCPPGWMLTCTNTQTHLTYVHARCATACHERAFNVHSCACSVPYSDPVTITVPVCHAGVMPGSSTLLNMPQYVKRRHALVAPSSIISLCLSLLTIVLLPATCGAYACTRAFAQLPRHARIICSVVLEAQPRAKQHQTYRRGTHTQQVQHRCILHPSRVRSHSGRVVVRFVWCARVVNPT